VTPQQQRISLVGVQRGAHRVGHIRGFRIALESQQHNQQYDQRGWPGRCGEKADQSQGLWPLGDRDSDRCADFFSQAHCDRLPGVRGYPSGLTLGHGARRGNDCLRIASGLVVGVQLPCSSLRC
jgi:hypothetical protein